MGEWVWIFSATTHLYLIFKSFYFHSNTPVMWSSPPSSSTTANTTNRNVFNLKGPDASRINCHEIRCHSWLCTFCDHLDNKTVQRLILSAPLKYFIKILTLLTDCNSDMNKHNILLSHTVSSTYITWEAVRRNWMVICRDFMVFHVLPNVSQVLCNMKNYLRIPFTTIGLSLRWLMSLYVIINKTL